MSSNPFVVNNRVNQGYPPRGVPLAKPSPCLRYRLRGAQIRPTKGLSRKFVKTEDLTRGKYGAQGFASSPIIASEVGSYANTSGDGCGPGHLKLHRVGVTLLTLDGVAQGDEEQHQQDHRFKLPAHANVAVDLPALLSWNG